MTEERKSGLYFIGTGVGSYKDLTLKGLELIRAADEIYCDNYTNFSTPLPDELEKKAGIDPDRIKLINRSDLEENSDIIIHKASISKIALLVPGDPFLATTHVNLRIEAVKTGVPVQIANNASIFSLAASLSGLHSYKFGRTVTFPFPENRSLYPYDTIAKNLAAGNHTLVLLDIEVPRNRFLDISAALKMLLEDENTQKKEVIRPKSLFIALAKLGNTKQVVKPGKVEELVELQWETIGPPQSIIACADLHFTEKEALEIIC
ncbi:MAG: diphthine synthase [Candidatus Hodarchaeales archaeon]